MSKTLNGVLVNFDACHRLSTESRGISKELNGNPLEIKLVSMQLQEFQSNFTGIKKNIQDMVRKSFGAIFAIDLISLNGLSEDLSNFQE